MGTVAEPKADRQRLDRFFEGLRARVEIAKEVDAQLDRQLARRFNVLDYIRTSELGLSRVVGDLFDPKASHGQELLFLDTFLHGLKKSSENARRPLDLTLGYGDEWTVRRNTVRVRLERVIAGGRRLDVSVEFEGSDGKTRCLAIENKPYAGDQKDQIHDYLDFMEKEYGGRSDGKPTRHLLIYLSRTGEGPSEWSVRGSRLAREVGERDFAVMGYSSRPNESESTEKSVSDDDSDPSRLFLDYTIAEWFASCRRACDIDRLRSFLRDAESFCERRFGGSSMADTETQQIVSFLQAPNNRDLAEAVHQHWPAARGAFLRDFASRLARRISEEVGDRFGLKGRENSVTGLDDKYQGISLFPLGDAWRVGANQVKIRLEAQSPRATNWVIGVTGGIDVIRDTVGPLAKALQKRRDSRGWPWFEFVDERWRWWNKIALALAREPDDGEATKYFVGRFGEICEKAIPIIDKAVGRTRETTGS